jgi:hypothetical protein
LDLRILKGLGGVAGAPSQNEWPGAREDIPHTPRVFCQRVRKMLKTKEGDAKKRCKSVEECAKGWEYRR